MAKERDSQIIADGIYRKLMLESHKKLESTIDVGPKICLALAFIALLYMVW